MKKIISLVLALLIPLLGCATPSYLSEGSSSTYLQAIEEGEWVELASPRRSPDSARQILEEAVDTGRDHLRVFTSDGDTVVMKDPTLRARGQLTVRDTGKHSSGRCHKVAGRPLTRGTNGNRGG